MPLDNSQYKGPFVLFGNGSLPTHTIPINILKSAVTILCTDGGADKLKNLELQPDIILGDMDSLSLAHESYNCEIIELSFREYTLKESYDYGEASGWLYFIMVTNIHDHFY